jgi:flagellar hook-basal body complex protein FliE
MAGESQDLHETLIAVQRADLTFQMMMQVRNKILQAYNEIMRMPM